MRVALITVGDELLAGDTVNTNAAWLGRRLTERGAHVERTVVVPDRVPDIAREVNEARAEYDAVIVTGGLGPTHDDVTMDGVAAALGVPIEESEDAIEWFEEYSEYAYSDLDAGTVDLPRGARLLPNVEGVAPGAVIEAEDDVPIYVLPGVPDEMKAMFEEVEGEFAGPERTRTFIDADEPESMLIERFEEVRERFDVGIGSYPGEVVRIRIEGEDETEVEAAAEWLRERIEEATDTGS